MPPDRSAGFTSLQWQKRRIVSAWAAADFCFRFWFPVQNIFVLFWGRGSARVHRQTDRTTVKRRSQDVPCVDKGQLKKTSLWRFFLFPKRNVYGPWRRIIPSLQIYFAFIDIHERACQTKRAVYIFKQQLCHCSACTSHSWLLPHDCCQSVKLYFLNSLVLVQPPILWRSVSCTAGFFPGGKLHVNPNVRTASCFLVLTREIFLTAPFCCSSVCAKFKNIARTRFFPSPLCLYASPFQKNCSFPPCQMCEKKINYGWYITIFLTLLSSSDWADLENTKPCLFHKHVFSGGSCSLDFQVFFCVVGKNSAMHRMLDCPTGKWQRTILMSCQDQQLGSVALITPGMRPHSFQACNNKSEKDWK